MQQNTRKSTQINASKSLIDTIFCHESTYFILNLLERLETTFLFQYQIIFVKQLGVLFFPKSMVLSQNFAVSPAGDINARISSLYLSRILQNLSHAPAARV